MVQPSPFAVAPPINTNHAPVSPSEPFRIWLCGLPMLCHNNILITIHITIHTSWHLSLYGNPFGKESTAEDTNPQTIETQTHHCRYNAVSTCETSSTYFANMLAAITSNDELPLNTTKILQFRSVDGWPMT